MYTVMAKKMSGGEDGETDDKYVKLRTVTDRAEVSGQSGSDHEGLWVSE